MRRTGFVVAWLAATAVVTILAWQVVSAADAQVRDRPLTPVVATSAAPSVPSESVDQSSTTEGARASTTPTTEVDDDSSTTTSLGSTTTTRATSSSTSPTTTLTSTTDATTVSTTSTTLATTPTTAASSSDHGTRSIPTTAGTVTVAYAPGSVQLVAIVPNPGWSYEVVKDTGSDVEVRFDGISGERLVVRARWHDGRFETSVSTESNDG